MRKVRKLGVSLPKAPVKSEHAEGTLPPGTDDVIVLEATTQAEAETPQPTLS